MKKIFVLTGEPSGDKLASTVISKFKEDNPNVDYLSVGGQHLKSLGDRCISVPGYAEELFTSEERCLLPGRLQLEGLLIPHGICRFPYQIQILKLVMESLGRTFRPLCAEEGATSWAGKFSSAGRPCVVSVPLRDTIMTYARDTRRLLVLRLKFIQERFPDSIHVPFKQLCVPLFLGYESQFEAIHVGEEKWVEKSRVIEILGSSFQNSMMLFNVIMCADGNLDIGMLLSRLLHIFINCIFRPPSILCDNV